mmetsp:Transcript_48714/g.154348  ORF Transcript_48714/g.154348 Transcript_48714/m.154348 type:complete len:309 (+) Transcript_48714:1815-2741(+)
MRVSLARPRGCLLDATAITGCRGRPTTSSSSFAASLRATAQKRCSSLTSFLTRSLAARRHASCRSRKGRSLPRTARRCVACRSLRCAACSSWSRLVTRSCRTTWRWCGFTSSIPTRSTRRSMECLPTATRPCRSSTIWAKPHDAGSTTPTSIRQIGQPSLQAAYLAIICEKNQERPRPNARSFVSPTVQHAWALSLASEAVHGTSRETASSQAAQTPRAATGLFTTSTSTSAHSRRLRRQIRCRREARHHRRLRHQHRRQPTLRAPSPSYATRSTTKPASSATSSSSCQREPASSGPSARSCACTSRT